MIGKFIAVVFYALRKLGITIRLKQRDTAEYSQNTFINRLWNDSIYRMLATDKVRNRAYKSAMSKKITNKSKVLEIGTGAQAFLTLMAHDANPQIITTIEENKESYHLAKKLIEKENINKIKLLKGNSTQVAVEEKHSVFVQDIIGAIGSSEGWELAIKDAKERMLDDNAVFIPQACLTFFTPVGSLKLNLSEKILNRLLTGKSNDEPGFYPVYNFPRKLMLSAPQLFERLDCSEDVELYAEAHNIFKIEQEGAFDGLLFHLEIQFDETVKINSLLEITNWSTPYVKVFREPVLVKSGDTIELTSTRDLRTTNPVYEVKVTVRTASANYTGSFKWSSRNRWAVSE